MQNVADLSMHDGDYLLARRRLAFAMAPAFCPDTHLTHHRQNEDEESKPLVAKAWFPTLVSWAARHFFEPSFARDLFWSAKISKGAETCPHLGYGFMSPESGRQLRTL